MLFLRVRLNNSTVEGSRLGLCSQAVSIRAGPLPVHVEFTARFGDRLASLSQAVFCTGLTSSETDVPGSLPHGATDRIALAGAKESGRGRAGAAEVRKGQLQGREPVRGESGRYHRRHGARGCDI